MGPSNLHSYFTFFSKLLDAVCSDETRREPTLEENRFLSQHIGNEYLIYHCVSRTRQDVGHWLDEPYLKLAITESLLIIYALGKFPFIEKRWRTCLSTAYYNPITGELIIGQGEENLRSLKLSPIIAREIIKQGAIESPVLQESPC